VPVLLIEKERFFRGDTYLPELKQYGVDFIVLAGFLWKIPVALINAYPNRMINIHPALLPKYGGKGMYGMKVHEAVLLAGEKESGITIHYVNEHFDEGEHIFQASCAIEAHDTPESLAAKVHALEHRHFPEELVKLLRILI
jgi:phosphoribosylglycinamide formyltransferase-1